MSTLVTCVYITNSEEVFVMFSMFRTTDESIDELQSKLQRCRLQYTGLYLHRGSNIL